MGVGKRHPYVPASGKRPGESGYCQHPGCGKRDFNDIHDDVEEGTMNAPKLHLADPEDGTLTETRCRDCGQLVYRTVTGDGPRYAHKDSKMLFATCPPSCTVDHGIGAR